MRNNPHIIESVQRVYDWLDSEIQGNDSFVNGCKVCGKCCDFDGFEHKLFVTSPELIYFRHKTGDEKLKQMTSLLQK